MAITAGQDALASDFINTTAGTSDSGKVPKLNSDGKLDVSFSNFETITKTADEAISQYDAVSIVKSNVDIVASTKDAESTADTGQDSVKSSDSSVRSCQSFTISSPYNKLFEIDVLLATNDTNTKTVYWNVYAADANDKPTGASLANGSWNVNIVAATIYTAQPNIDVVAGNKYCIVIYFTTGTAQYVYWRKGTTSSYANGVASTTVDSGSTWTNQAYDYVFETRCKRVSITGRIVKASALASDYLANQYIGIALETIAFEASGKVQLFGILQNASWDFSSILDGDSEPIIYLSDTSGQISTSAGTQIRKIGKAVDTDKMFLVPSFLT